MSNRLNDPLFQLIKSLEKGEKRNFKLYARRNSSSDNLKVIQLYDALDKMKEYDEGQLLNRNKNLSKQQLSNLKAHLYRQLLESLRLISNDDNIDIQLHRQMGHARILYNKGLYMQSLKVLDKMKETARTFNQLTYLQQVLFFEKKIEALFITRSMKDRAESLSSESEAVNSQLSLVNQLSNLSLQLYGWFIQHGHARNEKDICDVSEFFERQLPANHGQVKSFYEKLYLYQCYCWYAFIRQDFLQYYRYAQKWVDLFDGEPGMIAVETATYIKGLHNLMGAHFDLMNHSKLRENISKLEAFTKEKLVTGNNNNRVIALVYLYTARINLHFIEGTFSSGLELVPKVESMLEEFGYYLDAHRVLVFYYKIACLYFGSGDNEKSIDYLNRIIHNKGDLRTDLQCYARLLHLIAHYELKNFELLEYLVKSVYRFMAKMENLSLVEEEIFGFIRRSFHLNVSSLKPEFESLLDRLKKLERNPLETRAFVYLDFISWLESKIHGGNVQDVIREKHLTAGDGRRETRDGRRETEDARRETEDARRETREGRRETTEGVSPVIPEI